MTDAYRGLAGEDYDLLLDQAAEAILADDQAGIERMAAHLDLVSPF